MYAVLFKNSIIMNDIEIKEVFLLIKLIAATLHGTNNRNSRKGEGNKNGLKNAQIKVPPLALIRAHFQIPFSHLLTMRL